MIALSACIHSHGYVSLNSNNLDKKAVSETFYHTTTTYTPSILHLTLTRRNSLIINILLSVRYYKFHLHTTYTPHMLPHGTSTGGGYYGIGEQKSLLLRLIFLLPYGVKPTAYDKTECMTAGRDV